MPHNFFKHGSLIDLFLEGQVLIVQLVSEHFYFIERFLELLFCPFAIVNLDARAVSHHDVPIGVALGNIAMQKPEIFSVCAADACLLLPHFSAVKASAEVLPACWREA